MSPQTLSWDVGVAIAGYKMAAFSISCKLVACTRLLLQFFPKQLPRRSCSRGCSVTPINICCKQRRITCRRCYDKGLLICQINCTGSSGHISTSRDICLPDTEECFYLLKFIYCRSILNLFCVYFIGKKL
jgi:hypothetical protein